jgi:PKHD-type hydroxylase
MIVSIAEVLTPAQAQEALELLACAEWVDGRATAGHQSARAKNNEQVREDSPVGRRLADTILAALELKPRFISAALPLKVFPPLFNRYTAGQSFGLHVDNAVRMIRGTPHRVRTDLSATLFLSDPAVYDGGELVIEDTYGAHAVKLPAGHMVLYPSSSLHRVNPVTRGARVASFFWIQSMVREDAQRALLFDMDTAIQRLSIQSPEHPSVIQLTGIYHNLLRTWAET